MNIRLATEADRNRLYEICLQTAHRGEDATESYVDPNLPGQIWVGPYLTFEPEFSFVVVDSHDLSIGYCIATKETKSFDVWADREWWPKVDFNPTTSPSEILGEYPSHGHINLLPEARGEGFGRKLISTVEDSLRESGSPGIHMRVDGANQSAISFYQNVGYSIIKELPGEIIVAKKL